MSLVFLKTYYLHDPHDHDSKLKLSFLFFRKVIMATSTRQMVLILITFVSYLIHLIFAGLGIVGGNKLFPESFVDNVRQYSVNSSPDPSAFSIWSVVYIWQIVWQLYVMPTLCRNGDETDVLSAKVFVFFIGYLVCLTIWIFMWAHESVVGAFVTITTSALLIDAATAYACADLHEYLDENEVAHRNKLDVWSQRLLVQNGLIFNASWVTLASINMFAMFLFYNLEVSNTTVSMVAVVILGCLEIIWFYLENCVFDRYFEYTFTNYISVLVGFSGILKRINKEGIDQDGLKELVIAMLIITCFFFIIRLGLIFFRWLRAKERKSEENQTILMSNQRRL